MTVDLEGTVALVTGASSGIGAATAVALAAQGAAVALVARRVDTLDQVAESIRKQGGRALAWQANVRSDQEVYRAVKETILALGRLDTVVNCAGVMLPGQVLDAFVGEWREMIDTNLQGLLCCVHAVLPHLFRAAESGPRRVADIVNVSSTLGRHPRGNRSVYSATKAAIIGFSEGLRQEVAARGVRVSVVEPGAVDTELVGHARPEALRAEDIADVIAYIVTRPRLVAINEILVRPMEAVARALP